jgi:hypothetical protein
MDWDGLYVSYPLRLFASNSSYRLTQLILDQEDRIVVACVGQLKPKEDRANSWMDNMCTPAYKEMGSAAKKLSKCAEHGCGNFVLEAGVCP